MDKSIWQKRSRFLLQVLIFSVALNVALLSTFCFFLLKESRQKVAFASPPTSDGSIIKPVSNAEILRGLCEENFQKLLELLNDKQLLEDGYLKRDFALSMLVAFHQFNLEKAIGGIPLQPRQVLFRHPQGESTELFIFSGLTDEHYEAIIKFAKTERWPLTNEGLFFEIKRAFSTGCLPDPQLVEAFFLSPEYLAVSTLLSRSECSATKEEVLEMLAQGDWQIVKNFLEQQKLRQDFSRERLRTFLVEYLRRYSKRAATILLRCDVEFALKRLSDDEVLFVLDAVDFSDKQAYSLARALLCSTRGERVIRIAAAKLYARAGEAMPAPFQLLDAIKRFCPEAVIKAPSVPAIETNSAIMSPMKVSHEKPSKKLQIYIVQNGDSLWKIAKKHHVSIQSIMKENRLESERLKPGQEIKLPSK